jgi:membrane protein
LDRTKELVLKVGTSDSSKVIGKYLLAIYFSEMQPGSTYGAAGSVILIILWVSYSCIILLFGAHFTKVYSDKYVTKIIVSEAPQISNTKE